MSENLNTTIKKPSIFIILINYLFHQFCVFFDIIYLPFTKMVNSSERFKLISQPMPLIYIILINALSIFLLVSVYKKFLTYDGSDESADKLSKLFKTCQTLNVGVPVLSSIIYPIFLKFAAVRLGYSNFSVGTALMDSVGITLAVCIFLYVIWTENMEAWFSFVPLNENRLTMGVKQRNLYVATFSAIAVAFLTSAPMLNPVNVGLEPKKIFLTQMLPMSIVGIVFAVFDFFMLLRGTYNKLTLAADYNKQVASGDYSLDKLTAISRDEYGLLAEIF